MRKTAAATLAPAAAEALVPLPYAVVGRRAETDDVVTLVLEPCEEPVPRAKPGQFNMLTAFGVGESAISVSGVPADDAPLHHTIRDVGPVSHALCAAQPGSLIGVRGPFGTDWGVDELAGDDAVVVAGGIGLAPLYGAVSLLARREREGGGRLFAAIGARSPDQLIFRADLGAWARTSTVAVTVDSAPSGWTGSVGLVTQLLPELGFDEQRAVALVCGPEVMIRFVARCLLDRGIAAERIRVSLERNMQCGLGLCGHCQLGPYLLCRDGPVVAYSDLVADLLSGEER